jgi:hypothetical protein
LSYREIHWRAAGVKLPVGWGEGVFAIMRVNARSAEGQWTEECERIVSGWIHGWYDRPEILEELSREIGVHEVGIRLWAVVGHPAACWTKAEHQAHLADLLTAEATGPLVLAPFRPTAYVMGALVFGGWRLPPSNSAPEAWLPMACDRTGTALEPIGWT